MYSNYSTDGESWEDKVHYWVSGMGCMKDAVSYIPTGYYLDLCAYVLSPACLVKLKNIYEIEVGMAGPKENDKRSERLVTTHRAANLHLCIGVTTSSLFSFESAIYNFAQIIFLVTLVLVMICLLLI